MKQSAAERAQRRAAAGNLVGHGGPVKAIAVEPATGLAVTGGFDYAAMVWDLSGDLPRLLARFDDHGGAINAVAIVAARCGRWPACGDGCR